LSDIADWLKGLVVVLLFAAFIDQIIPANGLQRYVKMTLRLFLFLTLLSPLIRFLDFPVDWSKVVVARMTESQEMEPLSQILEKAHQLQVSRESQAASWAREELEKQISDSLSKASQRVVNQVDVGVVQEPNGQLTVEAISVQLGAKMDASLIHPIVIDLKAMGGVKDDSKSVQESQRWQSWIEKNWGQPHTSVSVNLVE
jgi:stage III sporulation protein AF